METSITRRYRFAAAHFLPKVPDGHKCKRMHGHNYELEVTIIDDVSQSGFIIDFWDLDKIISQLIELVDHRTLNDIDGLENPTAELIAEWFVSKIMTHWPELGLNRVRIYEERDCWADVSI